MISDELLALLVCPIGKAPLKREDNHLVCTKCGSKFAIHDDIPKMLIEEAELPDGCNDPSELICARTNEASGR